MCYDIKATPKAQTNRAKRKGNQLVIEEIEERLIPMTDLPIYHTSGFSHPELLIYTNRQPNFPEVATWGLIPHWVKDVLQQKKYWNNTLNARGETIFEKPSFRNSALNNRCLICIDGFYEHHHFEGKTYPFYIYRRDNQPITCAGLWSEWNNPETNEVINSFSIVTTSGNPMMAKIHNNPKLNGPRMPLILPTEIEDSWLETIDDELDKKKIQELIQEYPKDELIAHTVSKLRGKKYIGNVEEISNEFIYEDLKFKFTNQQP